MLPKQVRISLGDDLQTGSPCIDAGTSEGATPTDIEGTPRPFGNGIDIGAYEYAPCPTAGDTHCLGIEVKAPDGGGPGIYVATATAQDDSGDPILYTFSAQCGNEAPIVIGPQTGNTASFDLDEGTWTVAVAVDDDPYCPDAASDAVCTSVVLEVGPPPGGLRRPGDANGDGGLDISDAVATLGFLFLGSPTALPCGDASASDPANLKLVDWQPDSAIDISDAVATLTFLFLGGGRHPLAVPGAEKSCVRIEGCPDAPGSFCTKMRTEGCMHGQPREGRALPPWRDGPIQGLQGKRAEGA